MTDLSIGNSTRSLPVMTALTPGSAAALAVSIDLMRACGCGLRRILPQIIPGMRGVGGIGRPPGDLIRAVRPDGALADPLVVVLAGHCALLPSLPRPSPGRPRRSCHNQTERVKLGPTRMPRGTVRQVQTASWTNSARPRRRSRGSQRAERDPAIADNEPDRPVGTPVQVRVSGEEGLLLTLGQPAHAVDVMVPIALDMIDADQGRKREILLQRDAGLNGGSSADMK